MGTRVGPPQIRAGYRSPCRLKAVERLSHLDPKTTMYESLRGEVVLGDVSGLLGSETMDYVP